MLKGLEMHESAIEVTVPFESASELQEAHTSLLEAHDRQIGPDASADNATAALRQLEPQIRQFLERGTATGMCIEEISDRTSCQVLLDYWVSSLSHAGLKVTGMRLARFDALKLPDLKDKPCPYVGLEAFRDQEFFFGREADIQQLVRQVRDSPLVVVLGASGSGKSSLVMGGVLPALTGSEKEFEFVVVPPFVPGNAALDNLAKAVLQLRRSDSDNVTEETRLRNTPLHLSIMLGGESAPPALITIDQFEELFTLSTPTDREALVSNLAQLLEAGRGHRVILTVREEFRSRIVELLALSPYLDKAWYSMRPMSYEELKAAVEKPAALVNLQFQSGIVDDLVKKVLGQPAALPLLQFTLRMLWEKRDRNRITNEVYRKVGDPLNALMTNADAFYDRQAPQTQDEVKRILLELVRVDELLEAYRQPVLQTGLVQAGKANTEEVITLLAANDYVRITPSGGGTDAVIEVKHEALIRNWPRLVAWIDEKRRQRLQRLTLTQAAKRWAENGRPLEGLLTGWPLQEAQQKANEAADLLEIEREFLQASSEAADDLQRKKSAEQARAVRVKIIAQSFAILALISIFGGFKMWQARNVAETAQREAKTAQEDAEQAKTRAEDLLGFLLGEQFLGKIRDVGNSSILEQIQNKVRSYESDREPNLALVRGLALRNAADIERMHGSTEKSLTLFKQALEAIQSSLHPDRDRETARTYDRLGEAVAAQGEVSKALSHYNEAVQSWRRVIASTTVKVPDCISLSDSLVSAGELKQRMGKPADAVTDLTEAIGTITTIPLGRCAILGNTTEPYPSPEALIVLSRGLMLRAAIYNEQEDYDGAAQLATEAKQLSPGSFSAKRQEAVVLANLATSKFSTNLQQALQNYRKLLVEFDSLLRHDPTNSLLKREGAAVQLLMAEAIIDCQKKAKTCQIGASLDEAELTNQKASATLKVLVTSDTSNISLRRDLGWALQNRAQLLEARREHHARLEALLNAEQVYSDSIPDPSDTEGALSLGRVYFLKSKALADLARWPQSKVALRESITTYEKHGKTKKDHEGDLSLLPYLVESKKEEGKLLRRAGDIPGADKADREGKDFEERLSKLYSSFSKKDKQEEAKLDESYYAHVRQGAQLFEKKNYVDASLEFLAAASAMQKYIDLKPADSRGYDHLRNVYDWVRLTQEKLGNSRESAAAGRIMVHMARTASLLRPNAYLENELRRALQDQGVALYYQQNFKEHIDETIAFNQREILSAEAALLKDPKQGENLRNLGHAYHGRGLISRDAQKQGWEEAIRIGITYLQEAVAVDVNNAAYLKELGGMEKYLAEKLDADSLRERAVAEYRLALKAYKQAARLSPEDKEIKDAIRELQQDLQNLKAIGVQ